MSADPFAFEVGGVDAGVTLMVRRAWFLHDDEIQNGEPLMLRWEYVDESDPSEVSEVSLKVGDEFTTHDNGVTAVRVDGANKNFKATSAAAIMTASIMANGGEDVLRARFAEGGLTPKHAALYTGIRMVTDREVHNYGPDIGDVSRLICGKFLGIVDGAAPVAAAAPPVAPQAAPAPVAAPVAPPADAAAPAAVLDQATFDALSAVADQCTTHDQFMEQAMASYELSPVAEQAVRDTSNEGVWGQSVARATAAAAPPAAAAGKPSL